ncbi:hypothetical protein [Frankia sp. EI5c]|uniref:hypothetical protein n=1 Tax=Frankia sp. EI5c TaxID=683316 RepID=UPI000FF88FF1|nr:hypothetical protein [Frankia sp. EI5c]
MSDGLLYVGFNVYNLRNVAQISRERRIVGYAGLRLQRISKAFPWFIPSLLWFPFASTLDDEEWVVQIHTPLLVVLSAVIGFAIVAPILQPDRRIFVMTLGSGEARVDALASRDPGAISAIHLVIDALRHREDYKVAKIIHNVMNIERIGNIDNRGGQLGNRVVISAMAAPPSSPAGDL